MSSPITTTPIEADTNPYADSDVDSAFSSASSSSFSASLSSSILHYRTENGRTYHAYREGKYALPNDDVENDRLDLQHAEFLLTLEGKLYLAPLRRVQNVLDVGTGTGIWAIDFADEHPEANVIATDLSPIQPSAVPPNLKFIIDDIEDEWTFSTPFDFIHARMLVGSISSWPAFLSKSFDNLVPGSGWIELQDSEDIHCDDGTLKPDSALARYWKLTTEGFAKLGRPILEAAHHKQRLLDAGFVDVHEVVKVWPLGTWPKDERLKRLGLWSCENLLQGLEGFAMAPLTRALGWTPEEVQVLLAQAREDIRNPGIHAYVRIYFVYGRRPSEEERS